jgi:glycosyltransferase involved in cell wall biosynthesis
MISTDRNIFDQASSVARRMVEYGTLFDELHIVIFSLSSQAFSLTELSPNTFVYPTSSSGRLAYFRDATRIGSEILSNIFFGESAVTVQDPFETAIVGIKLKKIFKFPLQIQLHTDLYSKEFFDGAFLNWLRFQVSRFTLPKADGIRVVREKMKNDILSNTKISKEKIIVLPIFVDIQKIRDNPVTLNLKAKYPMWDEIVLVASRFSPEKNVSLAIRAFKRLAVHNPKVGMVIVGGGNGEMSLKNLVQKLGLEENISFEPWQQDLVSYYKTASLFLNTSDFEGYGMALVEAGASGCPILTTNVGIAQDLFKDGQNALVCPSKDEECLGNKLVTFFSNPLIQKNIKEAISSDIGFLAISKEHYLDRQNKSFEMLFQKIQK